jgi:hypothetical protein
MSQGMKNVTVLDAESCVPRIVAVDERRCSEIANGFARSGADRLILDAPVWRSAQDATEGFAFLVSQFAYTEAETYNREYQEMQFRELLPITSEAGPDAATVRYQVYDRVGRGKRISGAAKDLPSADVAASQVEIGVVPGGIKYSYTQDELLMSARMIRPLPTERAAAAVEGAERHLNDVALIGEQADLTGQASFTGLLTQAGVTTHNDTTSGYNKAWSNTSTTFDQILADVNKAILAYWTASNYTLMPDTFGLAPQCFTPLATRYNTLGTRTLLQLLEESNLVTARTGKKLKFVPIIQASDKGTSGAGVTGKSRCVLYRNEKRRIVHHIPMPLRFLAPQLEGLNVDIPGWYKYAGVNLRYLYSMMYLDNMD